MPKAGKRPTDDPRKIPELSDQEKQERIGDYVQALERYRGIRAKAEKILPTINEIIQDCQKLEQDCGRNPVHRALRLNRKFMILNIAKLAASAMHTLADAASMQKRGDRNCGDIENDLLDPALLR
jgi:hypothetical protein